jgi:hypothetical protein
MGAIEPGEKFEIEYGNGHKLEVVALSFRQRHALAKVVDKVIAAKGSEQFEAIEEALRICVPACSEAFLDTIDDAMAGEIVEKVRQNAAISEDERKKSE